MIDMFGINRMIWDMTHECNDKDKCVKGYCDTCQSTYCSEKL